MPTESNRDFALVWSPVELGVVLYGRQNVSDLMFKKQILLLITELVVILKCLDPLYDQLCDFQPPPSAKMNNRSFVKKNWNHLINFKTSPSTPLPCGCRKCMVP